MTNFRFAALFTVFGFLLASLIGSLRAAPDNTLGMAMLAAIVDSDGTLIRGSGAVSATSTSEGAYSVVFDRNVLDCAVSATIAGHDGNTPFTGFAKTNFLITADPGPRTVRVRTLDLTGSLAGRPFHVVVFCPK